MSGTTFTQWLAFGALVCWGILGLTRMFLLRNRGRCVIVVDRQRTPGQLVVDLLALACLLIWAYEVVAYAWGFRFHLGPAGIHELLIRGFAINMVGAVLICAGLFIYILALHHLGESWRMGIDRHDPGPLVTAGIYSWSRHPIYVAFNLLFAGTFLLLGRWIFLVLALSWFGVLHAIMLREERFLAQIHGEAYRDYCERVGRYFSWRR